MAGFSRIAEQDIPLPDIPSKHLTTLFDYWNHKREMLAYLPRSAFDPLELSGELGLIRIVTIEPAGVFRFRLYGSDATNPDRSDMTGKTTMDYDDKDFGELVTRHYAVVAQDGKPKCWRVKAKVNEGVYEYLRLVLPFSYSETKMDALLVSSERIRNDSLLWR